MKDYNRRRHPSFALCGLNCCLCPRYHTDGSSKCPGCGGKDFHLKHPTCAVITCNIKHDNVQFCFQCGSYPCPKYRAKNEKDSFITYKNVNKNLAGAKEDLNAYLEVIDRKFNHLVFLLENFDDGRSKTFFCTAIDLLPLPALEEIMSSGTVSGKTGRKERNKEIVALMKAKAKELNIELTLRK